MQETEALPPGRYTEELLLASLAREGEDDIRWRLFKILFFPFGRWPCSGDAGDQATIEVGEDGGDGNEVGDSGIMASATDSDD